MPLAKVDDVNQKVFDCIVIGGGTAGLAAAVRLSEDPSFRVLVLEAGPLENLGDPKIDIPAQFSSLIGDPQYDWGFTTTKQKYANNNQSYWPRGKGLGGSSATNSYLWSKPPAADIDAFESLGNPGWNWADYQRYSKKSETVHPPAKEQLNLYPHTFTTKSCGRSGPIQVTIPPHVHTVDKIFQETMVEKGFKTVDDPYGGDIIGTWIAASNLDPKTWTRSYAANAYLLPVVDRTNLTIVTNSLVSRILFNEESNGRRTASNVEFIHQSVKCNVKINMEVILSAGAINSPQILELSGIGQPAVLSKIGVDAVVDLPGVGENVQDHILISIPHELAPGTSHETLDLLRDPIHAVKAKQLHTVGKGLHRTGLTSIAFFPLTSTKFEGIPSLIDDLEAEVDAKQKAGQLPPGLEEQLHHQISALRDDTIPDCEILIWPGWSSPRTPEVGKQYISPLACLNHPFSRGNIHATSTDPVISPEIDPHYFESKLDLEILLLQLKFVRGLREVEPWKSGILREVAPGSDCASDHDLREFIRNNIWSVLHTVGSCSMLPREKHGVVDSRLKVVYGTTNLRVADLSIIPLHIAAHTQGEKDTEN
ncbi:GMC oxidoreductase [Gymnopilus junonius]|uniref:pyranose dehydrogenase (acceptor) n=1 Tax=Gymnopilus junonius TaxID=109634 RepID=A0A9P5N8P5_GYMJU|nr:GMC oxidoreductase [Gymnopilus junonius]